MKIVIAGGGTGGHIFPAVAIAQAFLESNNNNEVLFIGTGRPLEKIHYKMPGSSYEIISAGGLKGGGLFKKFRSLFTIPKGICQAMVLYFKFKPDIVIGVGGYVTGSAIIAARMMRIPVVIHEQNSIPGLSNRISSRMAEKVYVSFPPNSDQWPKGKEIVWSGNPIRNIKISGPKIDPSCFKILITGGSQGAHAINIAMIEALDFLKDQNNLVIVHQTGEADEQFVKDAYGQKGIKADVRAFFNDMMLQMQKADLVICRAGATTVAELSAMGCAAIFIPYPLAADNHQEMNARYLVNQSAADMILQAELSGQKLAERILFHINHKEQLFDMKKNSKLLGKPDAAYVIAKDCSEMVLKKI